MVSHSKTAHNAHNSAPRGGDNSNRLRDEKNIHWEVTQQFHVGFYIFEAAWVSGGKSRRRSFSIHITKIIIVALLFKII